MEKLRQNEVRNTKKFSEKLAYVIGLIIVLGSEFILRDVFLPKYARNVHIGMAVLVEWLILLILLVFWIPKIEGSNLESIGFGKFRKKYLWEGTLVYLILMVLWTGSSFALKEVGFEGLRSLQPMLKEYSPVILFGLFITGTFLEEVFYRGYLIERLTLLTGRRWMGAVVSWLAFTFVHIGFFSLGPTIDIGILSAALVMLYLKEKSIWPCVVVHGINNLFGFLIFPLLMG